MTGDKRTNRNLAVKIVINSYKPNYFLKVFLPKSVLGSDMAPPPGVPVHLCSFLIMQVEVRGGKEFRSRCTHEV